MKGHLLADPMAVTTTGKIIVNLAYYEDVNSIGEIIDVLRKQKYVGQVFVGVSLTAGRTEKAMKLIDDMSAELAGTSRIRRSNRVKIRTG